jgi:hypothetical protein
MPRRAVMAAAEGLDGAARLACNLCVMIMKQ